MTVVQRFTIELPNTSYVDGSVSEHGMASYDLTREEADKLWDELGEALGYGRRGAAVEAMARSIIQGPDLATGQPDTPPRTTEEETAAQAQVLAALAAQGVVEMPRVRDGSAIGSGAQR